MWYLYTAKGTRTCLQPNTTEEDVVLELERWRQKEPDMWFTIVHYDEITTEPQSWLIRSDNDYLEYLKGYYKRAIQNKSIMELKKEMFDIMDGKKPKTR